MSKQKYNIVRLIVHQGKKVGRDVSARQNLQKTRKALQENTDGTIQLEQKPAPELSVKDKLMKDDPYQYSDAIQEELEKEEYFRQLNNASDTDILDRLLDTSPEGGLDAFSKSKVQKEAQSSARHTADRMIEKAEGTPIKRGVPELPKKSAKVLRISPKKKSTKVPVKFRKSDHRRGGKPDGDHVMAYFDHKANEIIIDPELALQKYNEKAWLKPKVPGVKPLPEDSFDTYKDWERFLVEHEQAHTRLPRLKDEVYSDYENRMNDEAFRVIGKKNKYKKKPKKK